MSSEFNFNLNFEDLYALAGIKKIDQEFIGFLNEINPVLTEQLLALRTRQEHYTAKFTIELAPYLELFLVKLFNLTEEVNELCCAAKELNFVYECKRNFIQKKVVRKYKNEDLSNLSILALTKNIENIIGAYSDYKFAKYISENHEKLEVFAQYAAINIFVKNNHPDSILFKFPQNLNYDNLLNTTTADIISFKPEKLRQRSSFNLTDAGIKAAAAQNEVNYCIICHDRAKDSCSKGLRDKTGEIQKSPLNIALNGCPLDEKISEMNLLRKSGNIIASLATAMIDNPLIAATGHRICNDCMKACIYQKQEPVNIPKIESETLKQVLNLPYGFELYSLLTRWNPLNIKRPYQKDDSNYKILVVGQGPAGFNLAYHLTQEGHQVIAIDGLKIEPLTHKFKAIKDIKTITSNLAERVASGFGGVAEYGITVRWDKNNLDIIRLILARNTNYKLYGGVRFGSQITKEIAFKQLNFDHIALCMGAGSPNIIKLKNNLARGVKQASDFLMNLQLSTPYKQNSLANLQIRLPIIVVGGGLTAIDSATESLAYYPLQVEKFLKFYEELLEQNAASYISENWSEEESLIAHEFITHAKLLRLEKAKKNGDVNALLQKWGGVKVIYRKALQQSPAYRLNHEEIEKALEENIEFRANSTPVEIKLDKYGAAKEILVKRNEQIEALSAKTIIVAAGTKPNSILASEDDDFKLDGLYFRVIKEDGTKLIINANAKKQFITCRNEENKAVSFFGDMHPHYFGNVVKAMASAKDGYPIITKELSKLPRNKIKKTDFITTLDQELKAHIVAIKRLAANIIEIIVKAPLACKNFKPGQFYRLQNFETTAKSINNKKLIIENIALTGASTNQKEGTVSLITLEMGGSSNLCKYLNIGEEVVLMGPTGTPTEIYKNKNILLIGGGLGNAVLFSIGKAFKAAGSKVLYFAGYKKSSDRYKMSEIEEASDITIWACDEQDNLKARRADDFIYHGNIIEAIEAYASGKLGEVKMPLANIEHILAIGSDHMMHAVKKAKNQALKQYLGTASAVASINSPMQCMMKEICAQCLQKHIDQKTGEEYYVYSCNNQDQNMDEVDFEHLNQRLKQNSLQEKLAHKLIAEFEYKQKNEA
ncbi:MAG: FAD-dependent oxidoreductase [Alphaproteobacteria bacterium]|nr:FAD-dependent oxidoreductase [Alphaproteobacteria bacterium]